MKTLILFLALAGTAIGQSYYDRFVADIEKIIAKDGDSKGVGEMLRQYKQYKSNSMVAKDEAARKRNWDAGEKMRAVISAKLGRPLMPHHYHGSPDVEQAAEIIRAMQQEPKQEPKPAPPKDDFAQMIEELIQSGTRGAMTQEEQTDIRVLQWALQGYRKAIAAGDVDKANSLVVRMIPYVERSHEVAGNGPHRKAEAAKVQQDQQHRELVRQRERQHREQMKQQDQQHQELINNQLYLERLIRSRQRR